jgi:hypothetical protein
MAQHRECFAGIERVRAFLHSESVVADDTSPPQPLLARVYGCKRQSQHLRFFSRVALVHERRFSNPIWARYPEPDNLRVGLSRLVLVVTELRSFH